MSEITQFTIPGISIPDPQFDRYEQQAFDKLSRHLEDPSKGPILTNNEEDLVITDDEMFFDAVTRSFTPRNVLQRIKEGEFTRQEVARRSRAGRAIERGRKADMYAERVMTATHAADTCRSLYRIATGGDLVPVEVDDTIETITHRVGDYVDDLLVGGRETRLLRNAAMQRITDKMRAKFDTDLGAQFQFTVLAGKNTTKKIHFWLERLHDVSRGFERVTPETRNKIIGYLATRPPEYMQKPDVLQLIADKKRS